MLKIAARETIDPERAAWCMHTIAAQKKLRLRATLERMVGWKGGDL